MSDVRRRHIVRKRMSVTRYSRIVSTPQDYKDLEASMLQTLERVKQDRSFALELLYGTGMYTKDGKLKEEFR